jgi:DNA-binding NtrC family response regulator
MGTGQTVDENSGEKLRILIADDDSAIRISGRYLFEDEGWKVVEAKSPREALQQIEKSELDAVLIDMNYTRNTTGGQEGMELISRIRAEDPDLPIIVMTAWGTIDLAINAMKGGASDFVQKPWDNTRVVQLVKAHAATCRAMRRSRILEEENRVLREPPVSNDFICQSASMKRILDVVEQVAPSKANILILGENGTGKGVVARLLHDRSAIHDGPFVSVNVGGLPESLFESEMFGHVKGAFTDAKTDRVGRFEMAKGGTLFLDEIGNIGLSQQSRLLRLLETGEYERVGSSRTMKADVRIISATNVNLKAAVQNGIFREDLFFRLNTVTIDLPPLRDRRDDILPLAGHFISQNACKYKKRIASLDDEARNAVLAYKWPGNVRELAHAVERAVLMCTGSVISKRDLGLDENPDGEKNLDAMSLEQVEKILIKKALDRSDGNVSKAAQQLGMSRATFYRRLKELDK